MQAQDNGQTLGLSAPQVKEILEAAFNVWLKNKAAHPNLYKLLEAYEKRHGVNLPLDTLTECRYSLEFLSVHFPSNGSVGNNQFWKVICCLLHEAGGQGVNEPDRLLAYLNEY